MLIIREPLSQPFGVVEIMGEGTPSTNTLQFDKLITSEITLLRSDRITGKSGKLTSDKGRDDKKPAANPAKESFKRKQLNSKLFCWAIFGHFAMKGINHEFQSPRTFQLRTN